VWARGNDRISFGSFEKNVKESAIKFEFFYSSHENVIKDLGGHSKITIMVDDEETTFEMSQNHT
jgi:ring-1,2-phenylacetyl-CoA epoxidase subunit PaaE